MKTNFIIFCLFFIYLFSVSCGIILNNTKSAEFDGKCYAECEIEQSDSIYKEFIIYTGEEELELVDLEYINIEISPARNEWVKKIKKKLLIKKS